MKKSLTLIILFCISLGISTNAQNSFPSQTLSSILKDSSLLSNNTTEDAAGANAFNAIQAVDHRSEIMFGFKGGLNRSDVYNGDDQIKADALLGWVAGVFMTIPINKLLGFQPELIYAQKGFNAMGLISGNDYYYFKRKTIYTDIPLLLQLKPNKCISLFAGPLFSFLIHTSDKFEAGLITNEEKLVIADGIIPKNILGAEGGIDIYIQKVVASFRVGWDLQDINDKAPSNSRRYENTWMQATVGYMF